MNLNSKTTNSHITENIIWSFLDDRKEIFSKIYHSNKWYSEESRSGKGSELAATQEIRKHLPVIFSKYDIKTITDAPCGDFHWQKFLNYNFESYTGIDIVEDLIKYCNANYANQKTKFYTADILDYKFQKTDAILCRDCFIHLPLRDISRALKTMKHSCTKYLLTTNYPHVQSNREVLTGQFRKINLMKPPFNFPKPLTEIFEDKEKTLALWEFDKIL